MLIHYLDTSLRNIWRHRISAGLSIFALAIGLVCFLYALGDALLLTQSEKHFGKGGRVLFVSTETNLPNSGKTVKTTALTAPAPLAAYLSSKLPGLETVARMRATEAVVSVEGQHVFFDSAYADAAFLRVFGLPFVHGEAQHALDQPRSVVLTQVAAQRLFNSDDVLGRTVTVQGMDLTVRGVIAAVPGPSHLARGPFKFDVLISSDVIEERSRQEAGGVEPPADWITVPWFTYVVLPQDGKVSAQMVDQALADVDRQFSPQLAVSRAFKARRISEMVMILMDGLLTHGDQTGIRNDVLITVLGSIVVALACLNHANLSAAQAAGRTREVALRRTLGARRGQLIVQYLVETALKVGAACILAFGLAILPLPAISNAVGFNVFTFYATLPLFWVVVVAATMFIVLAAGFYPALGLSRILPVGGMRADAPAMERQRGRKVLVVIQFAFVNLLLILALVVGMENRTLERAAGTAVSDPVLVITNSMKDSGVGVDALRSELSRSAHIKAVSTMAGQPWTLSVGAAPVQRTPDLAEKPVSMSLQIVDEDFFTVFDIKLLSGRAFTANRGDRVFGKGDLDSDIVVNLNMARQLGWTPEQAIGKTVYRTSVTDRTKAPTALRIIGVAENKSVKMLSPITQSGFYGFGPFAAVTPVIRLDAHNVAAGVSDVESAWNALAPGVPIKRQFADDIFRTSFSYFNALGSIIIVLASFAALIAVMGLVGMATYTLACRQREIGIRKAIGSSVSQVFRLILWSFSQPVVMASVISWPLAFLAARVYLSLFATRAALTPLPFVIALAIVVLVTCAAVARQAIRAARLNPSEVLHYE